MNNWVRVKIENELPYDRHFKQMIEQSKSSYEGEGYNPLKCWNEQDTE